MDAKECRQHLDRMKLRRANAEADESDRGENEREDKDEIEQDGGHGAGRAGGAAREDDVEREVDLDLEVDEHSLAILFESSTTCSRGMQDLGFFWAEIVCSFTTLYRGTYTSWWARVINIHLCNCLQVNVSMHAHVCSIGTNAWCAGALQQEADG